MKLHDLIVTALTSITLVAAAWPFHATALAATPTATDTPTETDQTLDTSGSDEKVKRLRERLEDLVKDQGSGAVLGEPQKVGVVGTLEGITTTTLTITTSGKERQLVAVDQDTIYVRNSKTVASGDIQIGDYTIAMGYRNGNDILGAKRVVASDQFPTRLTRTVVRGTVADIDAADRLLTILSDRPAELGGPETYEVTIPKKQFPELPAFEPDNSLILVGLPDDEDPISLTLRKYKLIE